MFHYKGRYIITEEERRLLVRGGYDLSLLTFKSYSHYSFLSSSPFGQGAIYGELYKLNPNSPPIHAYNYERPPVVDLVADLDAVHFQLTFCGNYYSLFTFPDKSVLIKEVGEGWNELRALYKDIYEFQQSVSIALPDGTRKRAYFFLS